VRRIVEPEVGGADPAVDLVRAARDGELAMAGRRLALLDLETGYQPISSEDGAIHVFCDGSITNHRELRGSLAQGGHSFATRGDVEVLVHLYEERGPAFVDALRGAFALALWDSRARRLVLARDRFGAKPLAYALGRDRLAFGSQMPAPARRLEPGHLAIAGRGGAELRRYADDRPAGVDLRDHLRADVPVGVHLSLGEEARAILEVAVRELGPGLKTFSIGTADELARTRLLARRFGTDHREIPLGPSALRHWLLAREASREVKVLLTGEPGALRWADRCGMAHGLEVRLPLLGHAPAAVPLAA
jgi:asparagine synthase (glutamine-hydrolysing)